MNPKSDKQKLDTLDISNVHNFPLFLKGIKFDHFRHISDLDIDFSHPISVISGCNRVGKSTILMAIACSHFNFKKRNPTNGNIERYTWGNIMRFTKHDKQIIDWTYWIKYKKGDKVDNKKGQRNAQTKKWSGVAKKESQIKERTVLFLDLDRISPMRNVSQSSFNRAKDASLSDVNSIEIIRNSINTYLSYVLEEDFKINKIAQLNDKDIFKYSNSFEYSSFNTASGEDVLTRLIIDIVEAPDNSLILIDEIEAGLHPKIQRRLIEVLYNIALKNKKQFIITTHSPSILNSFNPNSRFYIEKKHDGNIKVISKISVNAAYTKMDKYSYPLINLFCEDDIAERIIKKGIRELQIDNNIEDLINIIISGSANITYNNYQVEKRTYDNKKIKTGYACILDGDMKSKTDRSGNLQYKLEDELFFLFSDEAPEKYLVRSYLNVHQHINLNYHFKNSDHHVLFDKMVEFNLAFDKNEAFENCWGIFISTDIGIDFMKDLKVFLINVCRKFSPDL